MNALEAQSESQRALYDDGIRRLKICPTPIELMYLPPNTILRALDYHRYSAYLATIAHEIIVDLDYPVVVGPAGDLLIVERIPVDYFYIRSGSDRYKFETEDRSVIATIVTHQFQGSNDSHKSERGYFASLDLYP